ncbi:MAG TPA: zf-HC2 domain-containing protein [Ktedonobacteraceae bacterium]|nr:zf-HC2 domain-containing protein [Ktedonobacteraceae bacterium]
MNCGHVEEQLSAYLDNALAPDERRDIAIHLQACPRCMMSLAELRQNDLLLAQLPRVSPHPALRERIFSSPAMQELARRAHGRALLADEWTRPLAHAHQKRRAERPQLVSLPGGRNAQMQGAEIPPTPPTIRLHSSPSTAQRSKKRAFSLLKLALAAALMIMLTSAGIFGLLSRHQTTTNAAGGGAAITPPAAGPGTGQAGPLAAGTRFVFLRAGTLWSTLASSPGRKPERLTPPTVMVALNWLISPSSAGHTAGNMLAYIDLNSATIHTIRSDGQQDTPIPLPLLKKGSTPGTVWETATGESILHGMAWSRDGSTLAFVADPAGDGLTKVYLYSVSAGKVQSVLPGLHGSISHPVWSPDSTRLALEVTQDKVSSILDYNIQSQSTLDLSNLPAAQGNTTIQILDLDWSPDTRDPAVTWSLGTSGHVTTLWVHHVGAKGTLYPHLLLSGNYVQALYSQSGDNGTGSWLVIALINGLAGDIWRIDLTANAPLLQLSQGKQVSLARWTPDGSAIFYMDRQTNYIGRGYIVNVASGISQLVATHIAASPFPAWSANSHQLAYSTGTHINIVNAQNGSQVVQLNLQGPATSFSWSPDATQQLVVSLGDRAHGLYLVDTVRNTSLQVDQLGTNSTIQWSEIP